MIFDEAEYTYRVGLQEFFDGQLQLGLLQLLHVASEGERHFLVDLLFHEVGSHGVLDGQGKGEYSLMSVVGSFRPFCFGFDQGEREGVDFPRVEELGLDDGDFGVFRHVEVGSVSEGLLC